MAKPPKWVQYDNLMTSAISLQAPVSGDVEDPLPPPRFYYSDTFEQLIYENSREITRRLIDVPKRVREAALRPQYVDRGRVGGEVAWQPLRSYLDTIEQCIAALLGDHSPAYWMHLYRRIAPRLSRHHDNKTDANTVVLVRRIAELAFLRHGDLNRNDDLGSIQRTRLETFLGGHYYRIVAERMGSKLKARKQYHELRRTSQSVMLTFSEGELLRVYEVEGLAYEYWKACAAMRSIGKGSSVEWDSVKCWFNYDDRDVHPILYGIYDKRIYEGSGLFTLLGTWTDLADEAEDQSRIYFASYNPYPEPEVYPAWDPRTGCVGKSIAALNFHIGSCSLARFASAHGFMSDAFKERHGVTLDVIFFCVWVLSFWGIFPERFLRGEKKATQKMWLLNHLVNLHFRGYALTGLTMDRIADEAIWWSKATGRECKFSTEEVRRGFEFMLLTEESRSRIGLWSGGKSPLLIPQGDYGMVIDLVGIIPFLVRLFFGVREISGAKGLSFEECVREAIRKEGLHLEFSGELRWANGNVREVDAAVRIESRLVLIECFSFERPLDYEIARPGVFDVRKNRLSEKIAQAKSLFAEVCGQPAGRNFDFSWATSIEWRLVSPFVEFAWDLSDDFFDQEGGARILNVDELLTFLKDGTPPAAELLRYLPRARSEIATP